MRCVYYDGEATFCIKNMGSRLCEERFEGRFLGRVGRVLRRVGRSFPLFGASNGSGSVTVIHSTDPLAAEHGSRLGASIMDAGSEGSIDFFGEFISRPSSEDEATHLEDRGMETLEDHKLACFVCIIVNRYLLNWCVVEKGCDCVATGQNLDYMAYFWLNDLTTHSLGYLPYRHDSVAEPLPHSGGRVKLLFWLSDSDSMNYVKLKKLPVCRTKCPNEGLDKRAVINPLPYDLIRRGLPSPSSLVSSPREPAKRSKHSGSSRLREKCGHSSGGIRAFCRLREGFR